MEISKKTVEQLDAAIHAYVELFEKKHDLIFGGWVADETGTIGLFSDYFIDFRDIRLDLEKDADKDLFFEWYDLSLQQAIDKHPITNYSSYLMGARS